LAELSGVSKSAISSYESGNVVPTIEAAIKLANALNVKLSYLLGEEANKNEKLNYINSILQKYNLESHFLDISKMSSEDLAKFEDDIVIMLKVLKEKYNL
jgi:transcriptional regulator with XRE-family HTH domain